MIKEAVVPPWPPSLSILSTCSPFPREKPCTPIYPLEILWAMTVSSTQHHRLRRQLAIFHKGRVSQIPPHGGSLCSLCIPVSTNLTHTLLRARNGNRETRNRKLYSVRQVNLLYILSKSPFWSRSFFCGADLKSGSKQGILSKAHG